MTKAGNLRVRDIGSDRVSMLKALDEAAKGQESRKNHPSTESVVVSVMMMKPVRETVSIRNAGFLGTWGVNWRDYIGPLRHFFFSTWETGI